VHRFLPPLRRASLGPKPMTRTPPHPTLMDAFAVRARRTCDGRIHGDEAEQPSFMKNP
jgi:hypothetical protein